MPVAYLPRSAYAETSKCTNTSLHCQSAALNKTLSMVRLSDRHKLPMEKIASLTISNLAIYTLSGRTAILIRSPDYNSNVFRDSGTFHAKCHNKFLIVLCHLHNRTRKRSRSTLKRKIVRLPIYFVHKITHCFFPAFTVRLILLKLKIHSLNNIIKSVNTIYYFNHTIPYHTIPLFKNYAIDFHH